MGRTVFPPCCLTWGQTMIGVITVKATSFKRTCALTVVTSAPDPAAGQASVDPCLHQRLLEFLLSPGAHKILFVPSKSLCPQSCGSSIIKSHWPPVLLLGKKAMTKLDIILKGRDITLPTKIHLVRAMVFFNSCVWMWGLDYKESWAQKNWCFWTVVLEKTLGSPLNSKEIQPVNPKGNQSWIFIGRTEAEAPILWPPDVKN